MQETKNRNDEWVRCTKCGHKLFRYIYRKDENQKKDNVIEIKCHSCKTLNEVAL